MLESSQPELKSDLAPVREPEFVPPAPEVPPAQTIVIQPARGWRAFQLRELWEYRELLYFLTWRDIKVRYKQTLLGGVWAVIQPFMMMVVFTLFVGRLAGLHYDVPYPVVVYSALLPWTLFASSLGASTDSLVGSSNLVSKVYFPRLILPIAAAGSFLIDLVVASTVLVALMLYYGVTPNRAIVLLPLFTLLSLMTAIAFGIWLTALNVRYRDVRYVVPFLTQLWLFASPVAYQTNSVPSTWRWVYSLNPMAGVIEGFRWALIGTERPSALIFVSVAVVLVVLVTGVAYFRRMERTFADVV